MNKLNDLILHPSSKLNIERFIESDSHALLLIGNRGAGKGGVLDALANELGASREEDRIYLRSDEASISINKARTLRSLLSLLQVKGKVLVVIIEEAERLTTEAQNALLKQLEEPADNIYFLLSTHQRNSLLPTVVSRLTLVNLNRASEAALVTFFTKKGYEHSKTLRALRLSNNSVGLARRILDDEAGLYIEGIDKAKQMLTSSLTEKLLLVDEIAKDKSGLSNLLSALERILEAGFHNAIEKKQNVENWSKKLQAVEDSVQAQHENVSARILVLRLMLQL